MKNDYVHSKNDRNIHSIRMQQQPLLNMIRTPIYIHNSGTINLLLVTLMCRVMQQISKLKKAKNNPCLHMIYFTPLHSSHRATHNHSFNNSNTVKQCHSHSNKLNPSLSLVIWM